MAMASLLLRVEPESRGTAVTEDYRKSAGKTDLALDLARDLDWQTAVQWFAFRAMSSAVSTAEVCQKGKTELHDDYWRLAAKRARESMALVAQRQAKADPEYPHLDGC